MRIGKYMQKSPRQNNQKPFSVKIPSWLPDSCHALSGQNHAAGETTEHAAAQKRDGSRRVVSFYRPCGGPQSYGLSCHSGLDRSSGLDI